VTSATPNSLATELRTPPREAESTAGALEPAELVDCHPTLRQTLKESWRSRHLIWDVAMSALLAYFIKYRLGPTWIIFGTFMGVIGWSLIGGKVANFHAPNGMPYWLYTLVGLVAVVYYWLAQEVVYAQLAPKYLFFSAAGLFLCVAFAWGISLWTAPLTAHTRDVRMLIRYVTPFLFFRVVGLATPDEDDDEEFL
jgi:ABC-type polysaccharide/polyol phosphate export permease